MSHIESAPLSQADGPLSLHALTWIRPTAAVDFHRDGSRRAVAVALALRPFEAYRLAKIVYLGALDAPVANLRMQAVESLPSEGEGPNTFLCHAPAGEGYAFLARTSQWDLRGIRRLITEAWPGSSVETLPSPSPGPDYEDVLLAARLLDRDGMPAIAESLRDILVARRNDGGRSRYTKA